MRWKRDGQRGRHAVDQGRPDEVSSHRVDTVNDPTTPWQILGDIRESLGRLEGKLDAQSDRNNKNEQPLEHPDVRLTSLEANHDRLQTEIGRALCRERGCQNVWTRWVEVGIEKK